MITALRRPTTERPISPQLRDFVPGTNENAAELEKTQPSQPPFRDLNVQENFYSSDALNSALGIQGVRVQNVAMHAGDVLLQIATIRTLAEIKGHRIDLLDPDVKQTVALFERAYDGTSDEGFNKIRTTLHRIVLEIIKYDSTNDAQNQDGRMYLQNAARKIEATEQRNRQDEKAQQYRVRLD